MLNHAHWPAECAKLVGKSGLRIAARMCAAARAAHSRKQLVGLLKLSGPVERDFPAGFSVTRKIRESSATVSRPSCPGWPTGCCGKFTSCTTFVLKTRSASSALNFVGEGPRTKIDYRKKGTLTLTFLLEDLQKLRLVLRTRLFVTSVVRIAPAKDPRRRPQKLFPKQFTVGALDSFKIDGLVCTGSFHSVSHIPLVSLCSPNSLL